MIIEVEVDSVKMLREALCIAQSSINESSSNWSKSINKRLQRLINELDKHRPLGVDGKHGDLHTKTCGCVDVDKPDHCRKNKESLNDVPLRTSDE